METFTKSRLFRVLVYTILLLVVMFLIVLVRPMLMSVYDFLKAVLAPFLVAMIISYTLNPIVNMLHDRKVPRTAAVLLIYAVFLSVSVVILMNVIPMFMNQVEELNEHMPELTMRAQGLVDHFNNNNVLPEAVRDGINRSIGTLEKRIEQWIANFLNNIDSVVNVLFIVMIVPFLAFYMMKDLDVFERAALQYVPRARRKHAVRLLKDIDAALGSYIRGQLIVSVCVGVLAYIGYLIIGMPYPLLMAGFVSLFDIIPYLGPFFGALPALIMATTISWKMVLMVIVVNMICQNLESNVISPQVVGKSMKMHPLTIILVLLIGGELAGIVGMILAVPFYAAMKVVVQHVSAYYIHRKTV
ncbi:AI-2E family transporter [Cohnella sp. CIP 111063]|jgi:Predicted permease|uniref:AI-2E family transporter n=1 Tax=unclassified Cohnella TaxID=2636738 RepID=UPI000B8BE308|nr:MULTISPECIES: AI-2E family transporter [unclassified Cohnella]OXS62818.1 AI-2E family transporter [Cohnella sp. CIP 111063]